MGDIVIDITEIRGELAAAQPRLEIDFDPEFQSTNSKSNLLSGHADVEISAGNHRGLKLPRMNLQLHDEVDSERLDRLNTLRGFIDLNHHSLGKIEEMRDEYGRDLKLKIRLSALLNPRSQDTPTRIVDSDTADVPSRDWEAILDDLGYHDNRVVELSIAETQISDILDNAFGQIQRAQEHHDAHRYDDAVSAVRKAILKIDHIENNDEVMEALSGEKQDRVLSAIEEFRGSLMTFKSAADLGGHPEEQITDMEAPPSRRDSELAIDVGKAYVRYISRVINESQDSFM